MCAAAQRPEKRFAAARAALMMEQGGSLSQLEARQSMDIRNR